MANSRYSDYATGCMTEEVWFTADRRKKFSLIPQNVKTESGVQPFPYSVGIVVFSPRE
jgi:hypothetical protein